MRQWTAIQRKGDAQHPKACDKVLANFEKKTDGAMPPCLEPCFNVDCTEGEVCEDGQCVDPCAEFTADECPCNYDAISKTSECWQDCPTCNGDPIYKIEEGVCKLVQFSGSGESKSPELFADAPPLTTNPFCTVFNGSVNQSCSPVLILDEHFTLSPGQAASCQCRLEQYTIALIQAGITVVDTQDIQLTANQISCPAEE